MGIPSQHSSTNHDNCGFRLAEDEARPPERGEQGSHRLGQVWHGECASAQMREKEQDGSIEEITREAGEERGEETCVWKGVRHIRQAR